MEARLTYLGGIPHGATLWDAGAFEGGWAADMLRLYPKTNLTLFEPVPGYAKALKEKGFQVEQYGLSDKDGETEITIAGDRSSTYEMGYQGTGKVTIQLRDIVQVLGDQQVHVLKLNIEGAEYPILDRLIETGKISQIHTLLVQFHNFIPNFGERYLDIRKGLLLTHALTWRTPFVWERWDIR